MLEWEQKHMDNAEIVEGYTDPVYNPDNGPAEWQHGYSSCVREFIAYQDNLVEMPEFLFCCVFRPFEIPLHWLEDAIVEQSPENYDRNPPGWGELEKAIRDFNKLQIEQKAGGWHPDYSRKVRVPKGGEK